MGSFVHCSGTEFQVLRLQSFNKAEVRGQVVAARTPQQTPLLPCIISMIKSVNNRVHIDQCVEPKGLHITY